MKSGSIILYIVAVVLVIIGYGFYAIKRWVESKFKNISDEIVQASHDIIKETVVQQHQFSNKIEEKLEQYHLSCKLEELCLIGVGGGGCNILEDIAKIDPWHTFICMNSDLQALQKKKIPNKILLSYAKKQGLGCGGDTKCGALLLDDTAKKEIIKMTEEFKKVCIIATFGGGTGSGAITQVIEYLLFQNKDVVVAVSLPFSFEGKKRSQTAQQALKEIKSLVKDVIVIENDAYLEEDKVDGLGVRDTLRCVSRDLYKQIVTHIIKKK